MPHSVTWNPAYEGIPADVDAANTLGDVIRDLKRDIRERAEIDHDWDDVTNAGQHKKATLQEQGADPTVPTDCGIVYTKDVGGVTELFYRSSAGIIQLTSGAFVGGATALLLNNNVALQGKETGGTARSLIKMNATDQVEVGVSARDIILNVLTAATGLGLKIGGGATKKIWHEDNDGPGSTLDADTLDGSQRTDFLSFDTSTPLYAEQIAVQTPAVNSGFTFTHGLGSVPRLYSVRLRCAVADQGYAIGDECEVAAQITSFPSGGGAYANSTVVGALFGNIYGQAHKTSFAGIGFNLGNWRLVFRAWK